MPKMDGIDACLKIREESEVPIIMLSAKTEDLHKIHGLVLGPTITSPSPSIPWSWLPGSNPS